MRDETPSLSEVDETVLTLEEFMNRYGNYHLVGGLQTDDLSMSTNALILGALSQLNGIKIGTMVIILMLLSKATGLREKILLLGYYLGLSFLSVLISIFSNEIYSVIIWNVILGLVVLGLYLYMKNNKSNKKEKRVCLYGNLFGGLVILANVLEYCFCSSYLSIWKELMVLYDLTGFDRVVYDMNYIFMIIVMNVLLVLFWYGFKKLLWRLKKMAIKGMNETKLN